MGQREGQTSASMTNIHQEVTQACSPTSDPAEEIRLSGIQNKDAELDFSDRDDFSPHYTDGIVDLEASIENLRKLLYIKMQSDEIAGEVKNTTRNHTRYKSDSTDTKQENPDREPEIEYVPQNKQFRSHSVFDRTSLSLKRLKEISINWDNEETNQRRALCKLLNTMKELIKEQEEKETKSNITRRLSALEPSEMSQFLYDRLGFQIDGENKSLVLESPSYKDSTRADKNEKIKEGSEAVATKLKCREVILHFLKIFSFPTTISGFYSHTA